MDLEIPNTLKIILYFTLLSVPFRIIFKVFGISKSIVFPSSLVWRRKLAHRFPAAEFSQDAA
jgi:hypothetical protein